MTNFEASKGSIGLMDFFSILLPSAPLTYLLLGDVGPVVLVERYSKFAVVEAWVAPMFANCITGQLVLRGSGVRSRISHERCVWQELVQ